MRRADTCIPAKCYRGFGTRIVSALKQDAASVPCRPSTTVSVFSRSGPLSPPELPVFAPVLGACFCFHTHPLLSRENARDGGGFAAAELMQWAPVPICPNTFNLTWQGCVRAVS